MSTRSIFAQFRNLVLLPHKSSPIGLDQGLKFWTAREMKKKIRRLSIVDLGMGWKMRLRGTDQWWNHDDPTIGLPKKWLESRGSLIGHARPMPSTEPPMAARARVLGFQRPMSLLVQRMSTTDNRKAVNNERLMVKKERKRQREYDTGRERGTNGEERERSQIRQFNILKKFG